MKEIESHNPKIHAGLTGEVKDFWSRHVNAERIFGKTVSTYERGADQYFTDLEAQRYRSHRHLLPWIHSMTAGRTVLEIGCGVGLDSFAMARHGLQVTAVDLTQVAAHTADQRHARVATVADAGHLPFPDNCYDYMYSFGPHRRGHRAHPRLALPAARIMLYHRRSLNEFITASAHRSGKGALYQSFVAIRSPRYDLFAIQQSVCILITYTEKVTASSIA